jgi:hypothetical protein
LRDSVLMWGRELFSLGFPSASKAVCIVSRLTLLLFVWIAASFGSYLSSWSIDWTGDYPGSRVLW